MKIITVRSPGAGKRHPGKKKIAPKIQYSNVSTGDIFRANIKMEQNWA